MALPWRHVAQDQVLAAAEDGVHEGAAERVPLSREVVERKVEGLLGHRLEIVAERRNLERSPPAMLLVQHLPEVVIVPHRQHREEYPDDVRDGCDLALAVAVRVVGGELRTLRRRVLFTNGKKSSVESLAMPGIVFCSRG